MQPVLFADIEVGRDLGSATVEVRAEEVVAYRRALGLDGEGPVPATFCVVLLRDMRSALPAPPGGIHAGQVFEFMEPIKVGDVITVSSVVTEAYERRGRRNVVLDTEFRRSDGAVLARGSARRLWAA